MVFMPGEPVKIFTQDFPMDLMQAEAPAGINALYRLTQSTPQHFGFSGLALEIEIDTQKRMKVDALLHTGNTLPTQIHLHIYRLQDYCV